MQKRKRQNHPEEKVHIKGHAKFDKDSKISYRSSLDLDYEMVKTSIDKKSIKELVIVNPRKIHNAQVNSIYIFVTR